MVAKRNTLSYERIVLMTLMLLPALTISLNYDNDFWFLLNHGRYVVEKGFPVIEPFTIHEDLQFLVQQWLFAVIVYYLHTAIGKIGVLALIYLCSFVILLLMYKLCMLLSEGEFFLSALLSALCYLIMCVWYMVSRPQIVTYILLLSELYTLEIYAKTGNWKRLMVLPLISVLLINIHCAMWWIEFAFLCPYIVEAVLYKQKSGKLLWWPLCLCALAMAAAGLINPYGVRSMGYVFSAFSDNSISSSIMEMSAPDIKSLNGACFYGLLLFAVGCYIGNRQGQTKLRYILLSLGTTAMALMSIKSIAYFTIGTLIPLSYYLKNVAGKIVFAPENNRFQRKLAAIFLVAIIVVSGWIVADGYDIKKDYPPAKDALEYLQQNTEPSQVVLYTGFYDGGYAEYLGLRAYIDPRAEVFVEANNKKKDIFQEYLSLQSGQLYYRDFLDKYPFTHILTTEDDILGVYLSHDVEYIVCYQDQNSKIFTKRMD